MVAIGPYNIELVPAGSWAKTLSQRARAKESFRPTWEKIRRRELDRAGYRCEICGADGVLECNERWSYDDVNHVQKLTGYRVVCPNCLSILNIGRTVQVGGLERALSHFIRVTGFTEDDLRTASANAIATWKTRSRYQWRVDVTGEPLIFGVRPGPTAEATTQHPAARKVRVAANAVPKRVAKKQTTFSPLELSFLKTQRLARIATASKKGIPEVSPVAFEFDGKYFWVGSHDQSIFLRTQRYRNITSGSTRVSLVVDDLQSVSPWRPRGLKVSGLAEVTDHDGIFGKGKYFRISPVVSVSWGIDKSGKGHGFSRKEFS